MTDMPKISADESRARELTRIKRVATGMLVVMLLILFAARVYTPHYPALSFVAAFAEAAAIGGLADWYAVVALFRAPLGLPIPHTAVIQRNQARSPTSSAALSRCIFSDLRPLTASCARSTSPFHGGLAE